MDAVANNFRLATMPTWIKLFAVSFAVLFFETMVIRWIATEIRVFAYFKNVVLIAAVVGMGVGCAAAQAKTGAKSAFPALLAVLTSLVGTAQLSGLANLAFVFTADVWVWDQIVSSLPALLRNVSLMLLLFIIVVALFDALGQKLGIEFDKHPALVAYSVNLAGSLTGLIVYAALCYLGASPVIWLLVGLLSVLPFYNRPVDFVLFAVSLCMAVFAAAGSIWSPYYRIDLTDNVIATAGAKIIMGTRLDVDRCYFQRTWDFGPAFLSAHPAILNDTDVASCYNAYEMPYTIKPNSDNVLILGAGTGNDVAAALRHDEKHVDAIEIDPQILKLGYLIHPEHPYADNRVSVLNDDARSCISHAGKT